MRRWGWLGAAALVWGAGLAGAQTSTTMLVVPQAPLLGPRVGEALRVGDAVTGEDPAQADAANAGALKEDGLQRFAHAQYGKVHLEALQFGDVTGAYSAFTLYTKTAMQPVACEACGPSVIESGDTRTLMWAQTIVVVADSAGAQALMHDLLPTLPKISGPRSQAPLLPTFFPKKGLAVRSVRYALGPSSYAAMGGLLPAAQLGWEKDAEAAFAQYADNRGRETLTLLFYPTPQIAAEHERGLEAATPAATARIRREGELVVVAAGSFSADDAENLVENIHLRSEVSFDKAEPLSFPTELKKTYSLLTSIAVLCGVGGLAAVLLGVFLGGGRALVRRMQGKDAATDAEFLSLHLDPRNEPPKFGPSSS